MGNLKIYIGPNGFGKSSILNKTQNELEKQDPNSTFDIPTEILFKEETKDTKDSTKTMQILLDDLLLPDVKKEQEDFEKAVDAIITSKQGIFNDYINEVSILNGTKYKSHFINTSNKKEYKKLLKIDNKFLDEKIGSGQASLFLLKLLKQTNKKYIFIDEPEKFCHQSLLVEIAKVIDELLNMGKDVFIATHSPDLIKLLEWEFENLFIVNELEKDSNENIIGNKIKTIDLKSLIDSNELIAIRKVLLGNGSGKKEEKIIGKYLSDIYKLKSYLKIRRSDFIDLLFANNIYLVEGINDKIFLDLKLKKQEERKCLITFSKFVIPLYIEILKQIKSELTKIHVIFDTDDETNVLHKTINQYIRDNSYSFIEFTKNIEDEVKFVDESKYDFVSFFEYLSDNLAIVDAKNWVN